MLKNMCAGVKNTSFFPLIFHCFFFRDKSMENHAKIANTVFVHKNQQKITLGIPIFSKPSIFSKFLRCPWVATGLPGRLGNVSKSLIFLIHGQLRLKTSPDGLREASGRPRSSPQAPSGYDFASVFESILHIKS